MPERPPPSQKELLLRAAEDTIRNYGLRSEVLGSKRFSEYFFKGTMLFNVLGEKCTRKCRFCPVRHHAKPEKPPLDEGKRIAAAAQRLGLKYVILWPVIRDDLIDCGASYLAYYIKDIKKANPALAVETFLPDYGKKHLVKLVTDAGPDVISYSVDTVKRLYPIVKGNNFDFERSIRTIKAAREFSKETPIRATLMLGFRENWFEVIGTLRRLRRAGVDVITIGQYYRPTKNHLRVLEYVPQERFELYEREAYQLGYKHVATRLDMHNDYMVPEFISSTYQKRR